MRRFIFLILAVVTSNLSAQIALIPQPTSIYLKEGAFPIAHVKTIYISSELVRKEALVLKEVLQGMGISTTIKNGNVKRIAPYISLSLLKSTPKKEAYQLSIKANRIAINAGHQAGVFYGIQTLKQLSVNKSSIPTVEIKDSPAFAWRGYMVDVGRNFQSIALLKQQIDAMAAYKLNIFHFHFTEDIAWRLASKQYPQLTDSANMIRNKGKFYTEKEFKELINYCKDRHITLVPEIDMPGHSAAFKRAMGVDMQSDSGVHMLKNILKEFFTTYNLPYFHIGADEVKITNKNFVPEISAFVESFGKKTIGWEPGGNFNKNTIRQLWMDDAAVTAGNNDIQYIDSRHLYLNHMDPLESVVTIFNRQLCGVDRGNTRALGATLCLWPDRKIANEEDAIKMNAIYPAMLAFAERVWLGGGYEGWVSNLNLNGDKAFNLFKDFENRLLIHKKQYFKNLPFPYQQQSKLTWQLYGPFKNGGDLTKQFSPELPDFNLDKEKQTLIAIGGTIILRHWWAPKIKAVLPEPTENTTWYAFTKIWSDRDAIKDFWIGFNNLSRSPATDSPQDGTWDNHKSEIWLNGKLISPPNWKNAGQKGDSEIPLIDEGYEYRKPMALQLKKGWNMIRIKAPIGSFKAKNWQNPEKWMFTFIETPTN
ncbi:family 20 glycosylhydrolase [Pedobacter sp. UC225_61]|uniref:family 20 glycosylhydrolase n=1 Tax=Pedobacter sp. UC225_61 TaxID=3374623 RepID=UPI0037BD0C7D